MTYDVDFYFDPSCPWTWVTSRWLVAASSQREIDITWRPFSLLLQQGAETPDDKVEQFERGLRAARVVAAIDQELPNATVARFYEQLWYRDPGNDDAPDLSAVLAAADLATSFADAADDPSLDSAIRQSMDAAIALAGPDNGSPIVSIGGSGKGMFGPVLEAIPDSESSATLWDHIVGLFTIDEYCELKRSRPSSPTFSPRVH